MSDRAVRRGRPRLPEGELKRQIVSFRIRDELKADLEAAARAAGRSVSEEVERRVEMSFDSKIALADFILEFSHFVERRGRP